MSLERTLSYSILLSPMILLVTALVGSAIGQRWPRIGLNSALISLLGLYILATPWSATRLIACLENQVGDVTTATPGAIVVLSGDTERVDEPKETVRLGLLSIERVYFAARDYRTSRLPVLVTGGASAGTNVPIADLMAEALTKTFDVPVRWRETKARTTYENAEFSAELLKKNGISTITVVTQAWHMPRAIWAFHRFGIHALPSKFAPRHISGGSNFSDFLPSVSALSSTAYAIHEILGSAYYRLTRSR